MQNAKYAERYPALERKTPNFISHERLRLVFPDVVGEGISLAPGSLSSRADAAGSTVDPALYQIRDVSWENLLLEAHAVHQEVAHLMDREGLDRPIQFLLERLQLRVSIRNGA